MKCLSCGAPNETGRKFCDECGAPLAAPCPTCNAPNRASAKFCGECGAVLATDADARPAVAIEGSQAAPQPSPSGRGGQLGVAERRLVSVLFADLVGFTTLAEGRDAEAVRELLSRYFAIATEVVARYGGTIEKFIGDAVMAVWGTPVAFEDDAERAVRAALDLVAAVPELGPNVNARAGVMTGETAVSIGATNQGMVAGDLVNTASRLQSVAPPGSVLVDEATRRAVSAAIVCEPAGRHELKGKAEPMEAWRAVRVVAERGGAGRSERLEAPFVGRQEEMRLLRELLHSTGREQRPRLVSVVGQAGIGKSRLIWELLKYVDGLVEDVYWHQGRSPAYGDGITFWALGEMVRSRAQLTETDDEETTRARVEATMAEYVTAEDERDWLRPSLLALLGVGEPPAGGRDELFAAWRTFFERISTRGTVALVFEDLHWADPGLLDFIDYLLDTARETPIYLLTLARPELVDRRPEWGVGKRSFTSLHLEPLRDEQMRELLEGLVPGLPDAAGSAIVSRADGIPLYAVETVRMLVADGLLVETDAGYRPAGDLAHHAVPDSLHALITARLDALEPEDRALVADGAVLGHSFTVAALGEVSGRDRPELESRLQQLVRRELLVKAVDPRSPERGQYAFVQSLIREVAYGTLSHAERRRRHLAAARYFEALGDDELAGVLAAHYLEAYMEMPEGPEGQAVAVQARLALRGAAERSLALGSPMQAVRYLEQAMQVTTDPAEQADLLERAGPAAGHSGHVDQGVAFLARALEIRRSTGERSAILKTTALMGTVMLNGLRTEDALAVLEPAASEFADLADDPAFMVVASQMGRAYWFAENHAAALEWTDRALAAAEGSRATSVIADTLITRGSALVSARRPREGVALMTAGQELAAAEKLVIVELRARGNLTGFLAMSDPAAAFEVGSAGWGIAERLGLSSMTALIGGNVCEILFRRGDWEETLDGIRRITALDLDPLDAFTATSLVQVIASLRGDLPRAELDQARVAATQIGADAPDFLGLLEAWSAYAEGRFGDAVTAGRAEGFNSLNRTIALMVAGHAAVQLGAVDVLRDVIAELEPLLLYGPTPDAWRGVLRASLDALEGRDHEAVSGFTAANGLLRDAGLRWELALSLIDLVAAFGPQHPEARRAAEEARVILTDLQATPVLERLQRVPGTSPESPVVSEVV